MLSKEVYQVAGALENSGLPTFQEICTMDSDFSFCNDEKIGNYRMSKTMLRALTLDKNIKSTDLIVLLYLLHVCDADNHVCDFNYREITDMKDSKGSPVLSVKSYYNAIKRLKNSGYITYSDTAYKTRSITILKNDVAPNETFLNLNHTALVFGTSENDIFLSLPARAKVLYLIMLSRGYSIRKHGSKVNLTEIIRDMQVTVRTFEYYFSKVETLIGKIPRDKNKFSGKKRFTITIPLFNRAKLAPKENLLDGQATYFGRMFDRLLSTYQTSPVASYDQNYAKTLKSWFYQVINEYKGLGPANVFKVFEYVISESAGLTFNAINHANIILANC